VPPREQDQASPWSLKQLLNFPRRHDQRRPQLQVVAILNHGFEHLRRRRLQLVQFGHQAAAVLHLFRPLLAGQQTGQQTQRQVSHRTVTRTSGSSVAHLSPSC